MKNLKYLSQKYLMSVHYLYLGATDRQPKTWPKPRVSIKAPALYQTSLSKPDELLSNAQRAPEVF